MHCAAHLRSTYPVADNPVSGFTNIHIFKEEITMNDYESYYLKPWSKYKPGKYPKKIYLLQQTHRPI